MKPPPPAPAYSPKVLFKPVLMLLILVAGAIGLRHVPALEHVLGSTAMLRAGLGGRLVFVAGASVWCAFGLPRQVAGFAAGVTYGVAEGLAMITSASTLGCVAGFLWARWGGRSWAQARLGPRFEKLDAFLTHKPFLSILTLRLLPVGSALLLNLLGGVSGMAVWPFVAATLLGALPQNAVAVLLGAGVQVGSGWQYGLGGALFALSAVLGLWLWRHTRIAVASGQP
ncbi:TVP38/TMEM64 family protein [Acetobacter okinawensis]|uniref:TVP38/TMEM64 family protein n=1 Tax=Acetobacter okinawensis TaxID=1076594 RepID=UPI000472F1CD|nr:VTT domain-containing protein [Acetobacter okinawensis]